MAELVRHWNDGGSLSATYNGSGDGEAIFTSDVNEGIDREMSVIFADTARRVMTERVVMQIGLRVLIVQAFGKSSKSNTKALRQTRYLTHLRWKSLLASTTLKQTNSTSAQGTVARLFLTHFRLL